MRSYILAVAVAMLLSAVYAFQNAAEITVHFLMFSRKFPQGVWEVIVFSVGAFLMWFFSVIASVEIHTKHTKQIKERDKRIAELEDEKKSLLTAFGHIAPGTDPLAKPEPVEEVAAAEETTEAEEEEEAPVEIEVEYMVDELVQDGDAGTDQEELEPDPVTIDRDTDYSDFAVTDESVIEEEEEEETTEGDEEKESTFV